MFITRGDGLIDREQAAELCRTTPDAISLWSTRGYIEETVIDGEKVRQRRYLEAIPDGRRRLYRVADVLRAEKATRRRGRRRQPPRNTPLAA